MQQPEPAAADAATIFVQFFYPEVKDLCKHFLTLISATLVFVVTFSEKIVVFANATRAQKTALLVVFFSLMVALGLCGLGLYTMFMAAEQAAGSVVYDYGEDFRALAKRAYMYLDLSGATYGVALVALVAIGASRLMTASKAPPVDVL